MVANNNEFGNFDSDDKSHKTVSTSRELEKAFSNRLTKKILDERFNSIRPMLSEDASHLLDDYYNKVMALVNENPDVSNDKNVIDTIHKETTKVALGFEKGAVRLSNEYSRIFGGSANNTSYGRDDLAA